MDSLQAPQGLTGRFRFNMAIGALFVIPLYPDRTLRDA
jgi:hypothetical protein